MGMKRDRWTLPKAVDLQGAMGRRVEGPDQPRSWAIALAACVINTLLSGVNRGTGLFYVALIDTYGVSRFQANLPFTMRNVVRNLAGPIVGAIGQRYGPRNVTILGGVFAALGIILCSVAPNVIWITVFWGGMHGLGIAMGNTLIQVVVTQYFLKYRATASGLALSGACLGAFVLPIFLEYLLQNLGLSGTFLLTGGIVMHVLPAAIMLNEPSWVRRQKEPILFTKEAKPSQEVSKIQKQSNGHTEKVAGNIYVIPVSVNTFETWNSGKLKQNENEVNGPVTLINGLYNPAFTGSKIDLMVKSVHKIPENPLFRERQERTSISESNTKMADSTPEDLQETSIQKSVMKMFCDPMFYMISVSFAAFALLFDPAITVIIDYLMDKGVKEDVAKYFISMLAVGDLVGRLGFGWVTDRNYLSVPKFMMLLQVAQGVCFLVMPFCYGFDTLMTILVIYGVMSGANLVMIPILVGKYLKSVQSLAIGSISFLTGVLFFAIPPLIGYYRDHVGSYDGMFLITGGLSTATGLLWLLEPLLVNLGKRLRKE